MSGPRDHPEHPSTPEIERNERVLNLLAYLLAAREPVTNAMIRTAVVGYRERAGQSDEAFAKILQRDLAELRRIGVPVEREAAGHAMSGRLVLRRDSYYLPRLQLSPVEGVLLDHLAESLLRLE